MSVTGRLEDWVVQQVFGEEFIVWGNVYEDIHNRFIDGCWIHTSGVQGKEIREGTIYEGDIITTRNNTYLLGKKGVQVLVDEIKACILKARLNTDKEKLAFYCTFLSEAEKALKGKDAPTNEVILLIGKSWRKTIENNILTAKENGSERFLEQMNTELSLLEDLLPEQLSEDEMSKHIMHFIETEEKNKFGDIMKLLKQHFNGLYDGRIASRIVKELLGG